MWYSGIRDKKRLTLQVGFMSPTGRLEPYDPEEEAAIAREEAQRREQSIVIHVPRKNVTIDGAFIDPDHPVQSRFKAARHAFGEWKYRHRRVIDRTLLGIITASGLGITAHVLIPSLQPAIRLSEIPEGAGICQEYLDPYPRVLDRPWWKLLVVDIEAWRGEQTPTRSEIRKRCQYNPRIFHG